MENKKKSESKNAISDDVMELSFEAYDKKYGIKLRYPKKEEYPGFPVSEVGGFRWIRKEERQLIRDYSNRKKRKPLMIGLNVALYNIKKRIHI